MTPLFGFLGVVVNDDLFSLRLGSSQLLLTILRYFFIQRNILLKNCPALVVNLTEMC